MSKTYIVVGHTLLECQDSSPKPYLKVKNAYMPLTTKTRTDGFRVTGMNNKVYQMIVHQTTMYTTTISPNITTTSSSTFTC